MLPQGRHRARGCLALLAPLPLDRGRTDGDTREEAPATGAVVTVVANTRVALSVGADLGRLGGIAVSITINVPVPSLLAHRAGALLAVGAGGCGADDGPGR